MTFRFDRAQRDGQRVEMPVVISLSSIVGWIVLRIFCGIALVTALFMLSANRHRLKTIERNFEAGLVLDSLIVISLAQNIEKLGHR